MRSPSLTFGNAVAADVTDPIYLIEMTLDAPMKLSTRESIAWNGSMWQGGSGLTGGRASIRAAQDWSTISVSLNNGDGALSEFLLSGNWRGQQIKVWQAVLTTGLYVEDGYVDDGYLDEFSVDVLQLFDGVLSSASRVYPTVELAARRSVGRGVYVPNLRVAAPVFNHLPAPGSVIPWNGDIYELQPG